MSSYIIELLGIIAAIVVVISFMKDDEKQIRIINSIGCILFILYGLLIHSVSVWILNSICIVIQLKKLYFIHKKERGCRL